MAQSRLRFSSRILKPALPESEKSTLIASKVRSDGTATSEAPRLDAKLQLGTL
jgi:hypothetical protein